jgi:hypothetical protein
MADADRALLLDAWGSSEPVGSGLDPFSTTLGRFRS